MRALAPLFRRIREKPIDMLARQAAKRLVTYTRRQRYWERLRRNIESEIARVPERELRERVAAAPPLISGVPVRDERLQALMRSAEEASRLRFDVLAATLQAERLPMPWRTDWRVGHEWPRAHFASLDFRDLVPQAAADQPIDHRTEQRSKNNQT
jgi:hypothetical protein